MDDFEHLDHYAILGVSRSATADEIKRAYRQQMARFHPDRFASAPAAEQAYATRRALRINEAYAALSNFQGRAAYNRNLAADPPPPARAAARPAAPTPPRDHLAELYEQAQAHLGARRYMQAAATLREIQQLNPFYRDSAALLAQAEGAAGSRGQPAPRPSAPTDRGRRVLLVGGLGALVLAGLGAVGWALRGRATGLIAGAPTAAPVAAGGGAEPAVASAPPASTGAPTLAPAPPTLAPAPPTLAPAPPTLAPTATPAPPTLAPTATPAPPTLAPTAIAAAEEGDLLYADDFRSGRGWPALSGRGWSVGFAPGGYQITAVEGTGNIWAYSTSPAGPDFLVAVDVAVDGGIAGLLLRYSQAGYLAFMLDPALGSYRLERRDGRGFRVLVEEGNPAIAVGPGAANRLAARLAGDAVALLINGQTVYELTVDSPPASPQYGMVAIARSPQVVATFSNLSIRALAV